MNSQDRHIRAADYERATKMVQLTVYRRIAHHLLESAKLHAKECSRIESELDGTEVSEIPNELRRNFIECLYMCVAYLEAKINQFLGGINFNDEFLNEDRSMTPIGKRLASYYEENPTASTYKKFTKVAVEINGRGLDLNQTCEHVKLIMDFRHYFTHYKFIDATGSDLYNQLTALQLYNSLLDNPVGNFPLCYMSAGYAQWACKIVEEFIEDFFYQIGKADPFPQP